jgi:quinoprotein glucose dehydrogenase
MLISAIALALALPQDAAWPDAATARKKFKLASGLDMSLWAEDPRLRNPVALAFDEKGRVYVAEDHRRHTSLLDIHMRKEWLDDDLACRTHDDIAAYHRKRLGSKAKDWEVEAEKIILLEDRDGDGRCDASTVFSEGYTGIGEGIGAGLLARKGEVWYTCIPNLWKLRDRDGDGVADEKTSVARGFGVHLGASGHDMHGLRMGPDGKVYWSHGDRGFHVEKDGKAFSFPDGGGVLRCNPDGSELEIVCVGLRNPQELAFDAYGNLFTGDNNISKAPDVGETCRWTYVVEGADYGWRIGYQFMSDGGAWIAEEQWKGKALFTVPAVAHLGHGPSGVACHPGGGPLSRYAGRFFMCDYPGGIYSFAMKPKGASFEMTQLEKVLWEITAPDVEVGWDGALWVADWVGLWDKTDKGRIWRITDPSAPKEVEVPRLMAEGFEKHPVPYLAALLDHADQRVRQEAQFELVARKGVGILRAVAAKGPRMARIHAIWGLGQLGEAPALFDDPDEEIRAQAAKVAGDRRAAAAFDGLISLLRDPSPRVRHFAARGLGRLGRKEAVPGLIELLQGQPDRVLTHAAATALAEIGQVEKAESHPDVTVRLGALLALRKLGRPEIARFLEDVDPALVMEAARAIWDQEIAAARPALAKLLSNPRAPERALLRAVNAAFALGDAKALAACAADQQFPARVRVEALRILAGWAEGTKRDRLMGLWRPVPGRSEAEAREALAGTFEAVLTAYDTAVAAEGVKAARALALGGVGDALAKLAGGAAAGPLRAEALRALVEMKDPRAAERVEAALSDVDPELRIEALRQRGAADPEDPRLEKIASEPGLPRVRQAAVAVLGDAALGRLLDRWIAGDWPVALQLDVLERASKRPALREKVARVEAPGFRECLEGGDAENGRRIFFQRNDAQCVRCHVVGAEGGTVGPPLTQIGGQKARDYLLEAVVAPNKAIAEGWGQTAFQMSNGDVEVGRIEKETDAEVVLVLADGLRKTLRKASIAQRKAGLSSMPEDIAKRLSKRDLRDLVEFLSSLR